MLLHHCEGKKDILSFLNCEIYVTHVKARGVGTEGNSTRFPLLDFATILSSATTGTAVSSRYNFFSQDKGPSAQPERNL